VRIFLDANILFSAARADGAIRQFLALTEAAGHELWADAYVFEEARRNLVAKTPDSLPVLEAMTARIKIGGLRAGGMPLPEKDRPVLAAAIHHRCDILVTGDRTHFGALYGKTIRGVTVMSPAMLAEVVLS
jgi:predicted nucleic acid-binding protein